MRQTIIWLITLIIGIFIIYNVEITACLRRVICRHFSDNSSQVSGGYGYGSGGYGNKDGSKSGYAYGSGEGNGY